MTKTAKTPELHLLSEIERLDDAVQDGLDHQFSLLFGQPTLRGDFSTKIGFGHVAVGYPSLKGQNKSTSTFRSGLIWEVRANGSLSSGEDAEPHGEWRNEMRRTLTGNQTYQVLFTG